MEAPLMPPSPPPAGVAESFLSLQANYAWREVALAATMFFLNLLLVMVAFPGVTGGAYGPWEVYCIVLVAEVVACGFIGARLTCCYRRSSLSGPAYWWAGAQLMRGIKSAQTANFVLCFVNMLFVIGAITSGAIWQSEADYANRFGNRVSPVSCYLSSNFVDDWEMESAKESCQAYASMAGLSAASVMGRLTLWLGLAIILALHKPATSARSQRPASYGVAAVPAQWAPSF